MAAGSHLAGERRALAWRFAHLPRPACQGCSLFVVSNKASGQDSPRSHVGMLVVFSALTAAKRLRTSAQTTSEQRQGDETPPCQSEREESEDAG